MITVRCEQCGREFQAQRRSAKTCSALCRQHRRRGHPPVLQPPTFRERFNEAFEEAKVLTRNPEYVGYRVVSVFIMVTDETNEMFGSWEFHEDV